MEGQQLHLPKLKSLELQNFSLYNAPESKINVNFENPVTCIIGANALGKSTMLNCINYGLTGIINQPGKKIKSVQEFVRGNRYAEKYFEGRISELDREVASVKVTLEINGHILSVMRNFYPDNTVVDFTCTQDSYNNYEEAIISLMGLKTFEQFAFLQTKVLTFDEERECLFWEPNVLTPTLFLTMGLSPEIADEADHIAREVQKSNSRIRNLQFEINKLSKRIEVLHSEMDSIAYQGDHSLELDDIDTEIKDKYDNLVESLEHSKNEYIKSRNELELTTAVISELTAKQYNLKREYDKIYGFLFSSHDGHDIKTTPILSELYKGHCSICDATGSDIWKNVEKMISENKCPLCQSKLNSDSSGNEAEIVEQLRKIDEELLGVNEELEIQLKKSVRLRQEMESLSNYIEESQLNIMKMEQNSAFLIAKENHGSKIGINEEFNKRIESLTTAILEVEKDKNTQTEHKDSLREKYLELHNMLNTKYEEAQREFLPKFRTLARSFTGLDVDITFTQETNDARELLSFSLTLGNSGRSSEFQLSESQRFFIDIALRMAMVDYIAGGTNYGTVLIDTPEGSLDIAYEANAGEMFAEFVKRSHQLLITANLNSSGLIRTLAKRTGSSKFKLINMLTWANLSSVQRNRSELFRGALKEIEMALENGDGNDE